MPWKGFYPGSKNDKKILTPAAVYYVILRLAFPGPDPGNAESKWYLFSCMFCIAYLRKGNLNF